MLEKHQIKNGDLEGLTDLNLAAFLATRDIHPEAIQPQPYSGLCTFLYKPSQRFQGAVTEWNEGPPVEVDLTRFMQVRRGLLNAVDRAQEEGENE